MIIKDVTATVAEGDGKPGVDPRFAQVRIILDNGNVIEVLVHQSTAYSNTINVEIDGDFDHFVPTDGADLRVNLNDNLIYDSVVEQPNPYEVLDHKRQPDLPDDDN